VLTALFIVGGIGWFFRAALARKLAAYLPDRTTRHRVLGAIVIAFAITMAVRLIARYVG
jgi:hypothetical protein